ncbi:MAG: hypothetical protein LBJ89_02260 [Holosporales bacterium]|jgi:hypothetical protein|nr:hypothetical protein [Holosporales bacterium]
MKQASLRIVVIGLYSERYPAIGESHGVSLIAGAIATNLKFDIDSISVLDMVSIGKEEIEPIITLIDNENPHIICISVPYGAYDILYKLKCSIASYIDDNKKIILGGPLPTYLAEEILANIDPRLIIVIGEGDNAIVDIINAFKNGEQLSNISNLAYIAESKNIIYSKRVLVDKNTVPLPFRIHQQKMKETGAQIFVESSRGCSWASCSFCLRGATDIKGTPSEFRRFPIDRLHKDFLELKRLDIDHVTFADEDFLGGSDVDSFIQDLKYLYERNADIFPKFDISTTIHSIFRSGDSEHVKNNKINNLRLLKNIGLKKVFLGIESGNSSQLIRYNKCHTVEESIIASKFIIDLGIRLEIGFIMLDPLCNLSEVSENANFLLINELAQYVSMATGELRLQKHSRYLKLIETEEIKQSRKLYERNINFNTLEYRYIYADKNVEDLVKHVRSENTRTYDFTYRVKYLTRFGDGSLLKDKTSIVRALLGNYRYQTLSSLRNAAIHGVKFYAESAQLAVSTLANEFIEHTSELSENYHINCAINSAKDLLDKRSPQ